MLQPADHVGAGPSSLAAAAAQAIQQSNSTAWLRWPWPASSSPRASTLLWLQQTTWHQPRLCRQDCRLASSW